MALTGSQKAYQYAVLNAFRLGASRLGYVSGRAFISIGGTPLIPPTGTDPSTRIGIALDSLTITDSLDETPNTCTFRIYNTVPMTGQEVILTLGSTHGERLFAGHILTVDERIGGKATQIRADVSCVDYTWQFGFAKVTQRYTSMSASVIAYDLITTYAGANGFYAVLPAALLPTVEEITYTNEDLPDALTRLARRIGAYWYVDYQKGVHLFLEDSRQRPSPLIATHPSLLIDGFSSQADRSQALTRVYVEGRGTRVLANVALGDTVLPLEAVDMFTAAPDVFLKASFQGSEGGAQHLNFTGVQPGGGGTLIGPGLSPAGAPALTMLAGTGLATGTYAYGYTDVTAVGESLPSPVSSLAIGSVAAPAAPSPGFVAAGVGPDVGPHQYATTFTTAAGETTPSPLSAVVTTSLSVPAVPANHTYYENYMGGSINDEHWYYYVITGVGLNGGETTPSAPNRAYASTGNQTIRIYHNGVPYGCASLKLYRSAADAGAPYKYVGTFTGAYCDDTLSDAARGANAPTSNTATYHSRQVAVSNIVTGGAGVTGRKLYRTAAGGTQLKLLATIPNNTATTYTDAVLDAALGANAPTGNTAGGVVNQVGLTGIAIGPPGTTARKVYRTVVNGAQLKLLAILFDNVTTTLTDNLGDGSLGANAPASDTSGFTQPDGQILAGATSILIAGTGAFLPTGGWAILGNGEQLVRYTGITGNSLTGVPPSGVGALRATVAYNSTITAAPMLTGIPASGARSISRALVAGDEVYLVVQVDDASRQAALADALGGTGIREEWVQDRRLSIGEARARGQATLALRPLDQATLSYRCRDTQTAAGKTIDVNLTPAAGSPVNVSGAFKIQQVTIDNFRPRPEQPPTYTVQASSTRFSFEDWLRKLRTKD